MKGVADFLKYNNLVPITISVILLGSATTYAANNPESIVDAANTTVSVDNSYIAGINLDQYTPQVRIVSVTEDEEQYYIDYIFSTVSLVDGVWQDVVDYKTLIVRRGSYGHFRDLGLFVTEELNELIASEKKRLKETQAIEKKNITRKVVVTEYSGLVGGFLSESITEFTAYEPVVPDPEPEKEPETFARPDPNQKPPVVPVPKPVEPESKPLIQDAATTEPEKQGSQSTPVLATSSGTSTDDVTKASTTATSSPQSSGGGSTNKPPKLTVLGDAVVTIQVGDTYTDLGAVVTDDHDTDLGVSVAVDGVAVESVSLNTSAPGTYTITYQATDHEGLTTEVSRVVEVTESVTTGSTDSSSSNATGGGTTSTDPTDGTSDAEPVSTETDSTASATETDPGESTVNGTETVTQPPAADTAEENVGAGETSDTPDTSTPTTDSSTTEAGNGDSSSTASPATTAETDSGSGG